MSIIRCPHDEQNPYAQISNALIRDASISPNARWLLIYLLSNKDNWEISVQQVINHVEPHMKRDKVYDIFKELVKAGYMKREQAKGEKGFERVNYIVSEKPKFKESLMLTEIADTENADALKSTQRTTIPKESLSVKKQQTDAALAASVAAAPAVASDIEKKFEQAVYEKLDALPIPAKEKAWHRRNSKDLAKLAHALDYVTQPGIEFTKGVAAALKWAYETQPTIELSKDARIEANRSKCKKVQIDRESRGLMDFIAGKDGAEVISANGNHCTFIAYDDKDFWNKLNAAAKKYKLKP
jgi:hypothetical protein